MPYLKIAKTLRVLVTTPSAHAEIPARAARELGFSVHMQGLDSAALLNRVMTAPDSFDLVQLEYWMVQNAFSAGSLQGIPAAELAHRDKILPLFSIGRVGSKAVSTQGTAPHSVQFLDRRDARVAHGSPTDYLSLAPTICNSDSLGWRPDRSSRPIESWGDLLAPDLAGRVAISRIASVSILEVALACEARGLLQYADKGNMSRAEIDATIAIVRRAWLDGQFHGAWESFEQSVAFMVEGPVALQSLWPPAVSALRRRGIPVRYRSMREGARGWAGGFALAARIDEQTRNAALDYINWYHSGWAGARLSRQGYYSAVPATTRSFLTDDEWNYWYEGIPSKGVINGPTGEPTEPAGSQREGGSYLDRMGHIAVWSCRMDEDNYLQTRWKQLMSEVFADKVAHNLHD